MLRKGLGWRKGLVWFRQNIFVTGYLSSGHGNVLQAARNWSDLRMNWVITFHAGNKRDKGYARRSYGSPHLNICTSGSRIPKLKGFLSFWVPKFWRPDTQLHNQAQKKDANSHADRMLQGLRMDSELGVFGLLKQPREDKTECAGVSFPGITYLHGY